MNRKEALGNAVLVTVSVLLVLGSFEAVLALGVLGDVPNSRAGPPAQHQWCEGPENRGTFHPEYGWTEHPGSRYLEKKSEFDDWSWYAHNDRGFRDTYDTGDDTVIVLGDSFTHGALVDQNQTFAQLLDRWSENTSFRNYGMGGYSTAQELLVYRNVSERREHSVVVLGYYLGNDMIDNMDRSPRRPVFELVDGNLTMVRDPENVTTGGGESVRNTVLTFLDRHMNAYSYLAPRMRVLANRLAGGQADALADDELRRHVALTEALIERLGREADANDAALVIVSIPERGDVDPDRPSRYPPEIGRPYWDAQREMLNAVADRRDNVHTLEVTDRFRERVEEGDAVYGERDAHIDDPGHRIIAREIHGWMRDRGHVSGSAGDGEHVGDDRTNCPG